METWLKNLNDLSDAWKAQFREPYDTHWTPEHFGTPPELPLKWTVDSSGMLFLDDVWVCPAAQVKKTAFETNMKSVDPVSFELGVLDGFLTIVIVKDCGAYRIAAIERSINIVGS